MLTPGTYGESSAGRTGFALVAFWLTTAITTPVAVRCTAVRHHRRVNASARMVLAADSGASWRAT